MSIFKNVCKKEKKASYLGSEALIRRVEILQGVVLIGLALIGISCLQIFVLGLESQLLKVLRWHHITMYLFFGLLGVANILCATISFLPVSLSQLMLSNAFFVQAFLWYNHTHGRQVIDSFVHKILAFITLLAGLVAFIEVLIKNHITLELLRSSFIILQGMWLWQIGFVIYNPTGGPAWNLTDHSNIMLLSVYLCWHYAVSYVIIGMNYAIITWLVKWRLRKLCSSEIALLRNVEEQESE
uniref:transmembrane protein 45A-like n=1 Tax=Jaculus jaculus TaxID=51337 RepID=UPI001E1AFE12|nr:transmembrane protein 45A-like [Jaculus jaculus]